MKTTLWKKKPPLLPDHYLKWLQDKGSFMERLAYHFDNTRVNVLREYWELPHHWESVVLKENNESFAREVLIQNDQHFFMFARTILPKDLLNGELSELFHLKNRPLGSALFAYPNMHRHDFYFACLKQGMYLYDRATRVTDKKLPELHARYSIFTLNSQSLLLTEVFFPDLLNYACTT